MIRGDQVCEPRLTLQPGGQHFYIRAGTRLKIRLQGPYSAAREADVPEDPLFGTRLFVCAKNLVLRHSRSLNAHEGPWEGCPLCMQSMANPAVMLQRFEQKG